MEAIDPVASAASGWIEGDPMRSLCVLSLVLWVAGVAPAPADHGDGATTADLRQLQADVERLDDSLAEVRDTDPRAREFRRRAEAIRDDLTTVSVEVRRHQKDDRDGLGASKVEVDALRDAIVDLRSDIDTSVSARRKSHDVVVPDGTEIAIRLERRLSSKTARPEDRVEASVAESVRLEGAVAIPAGTAVLGTVRHVEPAQRPARGGRLELSFDSLVLDDGRRVDIRSRVVSLEEDKVDKSKVGLGAVLGGILGAVLDGGKGALIGVLVGGGGAVVGTKGDEVELPAGTVLTLRLERAVAVARR
jgi:hypothetical protein